MKLRQREKSSRQSQASKDAEMARDQDDQNYKGEQHQSSSDSSDFERDFKKWPIKRRTPNEKKPQLSVVKKRKSDQRVALVPIGLSQRPADFEPGQPSGL